MTATELFNLLGQGSTAILALGVVAFIRGWLVARPVHEDRIAGLHEQIADLKAERDQERKDHAAEITRCEERAQQLWQDLREAVQVTRRSVVATEKAADVTANVVRSQQ